MSTDLKSFLLSQRSALIAESERGSPGLERKWKEHFAAWDAITSVPPTSREFSHFQYAKDAIKVALERLGRPSTRDEVIAMIVDGGWREGDEERRRGQAVNEAISHHLRNPKTKLLKVFQGDKIGLQEWEESTAAE